MPARKAAAPPPEEPEEAGEEVPIEEAPAAETEPGPLVHPVDSRYVLQDGQWVKQPEPEPEQSEE